MRSAEASLIPKIRFILLFYAQKNEKQNFYSSPFTESWIQMRFSFIQINCQLQFFLLTPISYLQHLNYFAFLTYVNECFVKLI